MDDPPSSFAMRLQDVAEAEDQAAQVFAATLEHASGELAVRWADPLPPPVGPGGRPISHLPIFDARYPVSRGGSPPDPRWRDAQFEWSFGVSELRDDRPGEVVFGAGVVVPASGAPSMLDDPQWLAERRAEGFQRLRNLRLTCEQLVRWLDVDAVFAAGAPADQGAVLADWIVATFERLAERPPPG